MDSFGRLDSHVPIINQWIVVFESAVLLAAVEYDVVVIVIVEHFENL